MSKMVEKTKPDERLTEIYDLYENACGKLQDDLYKFMQFSETLFHYFILINNLKISEGDIWKVVYDAKQDVYMVWCKDYSELWASKFKKEMYKLAIGRNIVPKKEYREMETSEYLLLSLIMVCRRMFDIHTLHFNDIEEKYLCEVIERFMSNIGEETTYDPSDGRCTPTFE